MDELVKQELLELEEKARSVRTIEEADCVMVKHQVLVEKLSQLVISSPELKGPYQQYIDDRKTFEKELEDSIIANRKNDKGSPFRLSNTLLSSSGNLVRFIDQLQDALGIELTVSRISLPKIIVVGDESVGKSSVLESIAGVPLFPRSKTRCTRVPFELRLHRMTISAMKEKFNQEKPIMQFGHLPEKIFSKPSSVREEVVKFADTQVSGKGVEDKRLVLNIYSTDVTDLTLIDLPGIVVVPKVGDPDNIFEQTTALVKKYMTDEDTLVLVVVPASHALISSQGLRLVRQTKAEKRTLGILTMLDRADVERDGPREKILGTHPDWVPLPQGYVGVINRDTYVKQGTEEESLSETKEKEHQFLEQTYPDLLAKELVGIDSLNKKLSEMLIRHIQGVWAPKVKSEIQRLKASLDLNYKVIGVPPKPTTQEVTRMISILCLQIKAKLQEKPQDVTSFSFASSVPSNLEKPPASRKELKSTSDKTPQFSGFVFGASATSFGSSAPTFTFDFPTTPTIPSFSTPARVPYKTTPETEQSTGSVFQQTAISAMSQYSNKSFEELRWEDPKYRPESASPISNSSAMTFSDNKAPTPFNSSPTSLFNNNASTFPFKATEESLIFNVSTQSKVAMIKIIEYTQNTFSNVKSSEKKELSQAIDKEVIEPIVGLITESFFSAGFVLTPYDWNRYPYFKQSATGALKLLLTACCDKLRKNLENLIEAEVVFKDMLPVTPLETFLHSSSSVTLESKKRIAIVVFKMTWKMLILDFCAQSEQALKDSMLGPAGMKIEKLLEEEESLRNSRNKILTQMAFLSCAEHQLSKIKITAENASQRV